MGKTEFTGRFRTDTFRFHCENGHNAIHNWVGGTMSDETWAAYDPLFWFHHCNVDRQWAVWQDDNPRADYALLNGVAMSPFALTADGVVDYRALGYEYVAGQDIGDITDEFSSLQSADPMVRRVRLPSVFKRVILQLDDVRHPDGSMELRVFVNDKNATAATETEDNPHYGSNYFIFSHDSCFGSDPGHCAWKKPRTPNDPRGKHHRKPFALDFDLTDAVRATSKGRKTVDISLLLVNADGEGVPTSRFDCGRVSVRFIE